jgi:hypothetical protein
MTPDHIYIINLNTPIDYLTKRLDPYFHVIGKTGITIFDGINGWDLINKNKFSKFNYKLSKWWKIQSPHPGFSRDTTPGEIGHGLSYYNVIQDAYNKGYKNILVLEEDFLITEPFPYNELFEGLPKEWSAIYLGRIKNWPGFREPKIGKFLRKIGYSYLTHAILWSSKGIKEIINSTYLEDFIPWDEFMPSINGTTIRRDAIKRFHNPNFLALGFDEDYIIQTSFMEQQSYTEQNLLNK